MLPQRAFETFAVGETVVFARTFTEIEVVQFIGITWDVNPYHTDAEFCKTHRVRRRIVPGLLVGSMLTHIGGLAAILASHFSFEFIKPVFIGDTITATCRIVESDETRGWVRFEVVCANHQAQVVARGSAQGFPAAYRDRIKDKV